MLYLSLSLSLSLCLLRRGSFIKKKKGEKSWKWEEKWKWRKGDDGESYFTLSIRSSLFSLSPVGNTFSGEGGTHERVFRAVPKQPPTQTSLGIRHAFPPPRTTFVGEETRDESLRTSAWEATETKT